MKYKGTLKMRKHGWLWLSIIWKMWAAKKELNYLLKAYEIKATVETITNLAHWLCYEYGGKEQSFKLINRHWHLSRSHFTPMRLTPEYYLLSRVM
ncbi:hypothetical protein [Neisseria iguanae]|uniref:hypothetical protein n=1 Tax=Neisseria iguanae TaxID=90242 RepID=UPI0011B2250F|nr:hypothetical protein [Neisseria iguanae]